MCLLCQCFEIYLITFISFIEHEVVKEVFRNYSMGKGRIRIGCKKLNGVNNLIYIADLVCKQPLKLLGTSLGRNIHCEIENNHNQANGDYNTSL